MFVDINNYLTNILIKINMVYNKHPKFDLNKQPSNFYCNDELDVVDDHFHDTALRLECFGSRAKRDAKSGSEDGCKLVLGFGATSSANEGDLVLRLGVSHHSASSKRLSNNHGLGCNHLVGESCESVKTSGGYMPSLLLAPRISAPLQKRKRCLSEQIQQTKENMNGFVGIRPKLFHGLVSPDNPTLSGPTVSTSTSWVGKPAKRHQLIPPQVLVPPSMKSSSSSSLVPFTKR